MAEPSFQLVGYLRLLCNSGVSFVVVGGVGSRLQGAANVTQDLDIMIEPSDNNLDALAQILSMPETEIQPFNSTTFTACPNVNAALLKTDEPIRFRCKYGILDVLPELAGVGFFADVRAGANKYEFEGHELWLANLDDIIKSKETADRVKDLHAMDALYAARDRLREESDPYEIPTERLDLDDESSGS